MDKRFLALTLFVLVAGTSYAEHSYIQTPPASGSAQFEQPTRIANISRPLWKH
ncbi:MAG: hypothetical protein KDD39_11135 [Bdellovibrionales bacterium]|nr:hypothetical protein [Bdellovibrionales bacterium]